IMDRHHLSILGVAVDDLAISRFDLITDMVRLQKFLSRQTVHFCNELIQCSGCDEICSVIEKGLDRRRWRFTEATFKQKLPVFAGEVRILFRSGQRELFADDFFGQDEPRIVVAGRKNMFERAKSVEARKIGSGKTIALS